jgi:hypothetical protein
MKRPTGLWIDHRQAIIVTLLNDEETLKHIRSDIPKHTRYSGASEPTNEADTHTDQAEAHSDASEDSRDRRFENHLGTYYDHVISYLREADAILILGPGEAKGELQKRLEGKALGGLIVGVKAADKMTDSQITAAVRQHFG